MARIEWRSPRISVQRVNRTGLVAGQLGTGVLVKDDIALLTARTAAVLLGEGPPRVEVFLGPHTVEGDAIVERRGISWLQALDLSEQVPGTTISPLVFATLDAPSAYTPAGRVGDRRVFDQVLQDGGDLWRALEAGGMIPPGAEQPPDGEWLDAVESLLDDRGPGVKRPRVGRAASCNVIFFWWC